MVCIFFFFEKTFSIIYIYTVLLFRKMIAGSRENPQSAQGPNSSGTCLISRLYIYTHDGFCCSVSMCVCVPSANSYSPYVPRRVAFWIVCPFLRISIFFNIDRYKLSREILRISHTSRKTKLQRDMLYSA